MHNSRRGRRGRITARNQQYIINYLAANGCCKCGIKDPRKLCFNHIVSANKKENISRMAKVGYSLQSIQEEIDKTEVVCYNCHHFITGRDYNWYTNIDFDFYGLVADVLYMELETISFLSYV